MPALTFTQNKLIGKTTAWKGDVFKGIGKLGWYIGMLANMLKPTVYDKF